MENRNNVIEFILLGFIQNPEGQKVLFVTFLLIYIVTIMGNLLIMVTIIVSQSLGSPMYFFVTFCACMTQVFIDHLFPGAEVILLMVLVYDRDVAICKPLHYLTIMNQWVCIPMLLLTWIGGFLHSLVQFLFIYQLPLCGPNVIDNFVCDMYPLLNLACTNTYLIGLSMIANGGAICNATFLILLVSYGVILHSLKTHGLEGKRKAFYTCVSHITVVILFFVLCIFLYTRLNSTFPIHKFMTMVLTFITPMLNPIIYTRWNAEMKNTMRILCNKNVTVAGKGPYSSFRTCPSFLL
ncbi:Olfactory receptor 4A15 [Sciurus carolinensis]|uniref:Olfactory receptor 4A15 n=1 Tax=Sciurus carolinensis TaxID=30640 RepID=A0AA41N564_SCICA|nr:Olfactory receptor 4A15 [Sciurus carolinensis]